METEATKAVTASGRDEGVEIDEVATHQAFKYTIMAFFR
jgi:hypothetical protein